MIDTQSIGWGLILIGVMLYFVSRGAIGAIVSGTLVGLGLSCV